MKIKLKVLSVKEKRGNKTFTRYYTYVKLVVVGQEEKGKQEKSLTVKFTEEAKQKLPKDARFFYLTIDTEKEQMSCPRKYEIKQKEDEETGEMKDEYPVVWVRGWEDYTKIPPRPITDDVEFEVDEQPTEEVEIVDDVE